MKTKKKNPVNVSFQVQVLSGLTGYLLVTL